MRILNSCVFSKIRSRKPGCAPPVQPHTFYARLLVDKTLVQPHFAVLNKLLRRSDECFTLFF